MPTTDQSGGNPLRYTKAGKIRRPRGRRRGPRISDTFSNLFDNISKDLRDGLVVFDLAIQDFSKKSNNDIILVPGINNGELIPGISETAHTIDVQGFRRQGDKMAPELRKKEAVIQLSPNPEQTRHDLDIAEAGLSRKKRHQIDIVKLIELSLRGVRDKDIAKALSLPDKPSSLEFLRQVRSRYLPAGIDLQEIKAYDHIKHLVLTQKQKLILDALTEDKIEAAPVKDLALLFDKVFDKQRLLQGQSTENISMKYSGIVEEIHRRRAQNAVQNNIGKGDNPGGS